MKRYNIFFSEPTWAALQTLSKQWDVTAAEAMRRILDGALGLDSAIQAQVEVEAVDEPMAVETIRRKQIEQQRAHAKLAHDVTRLSVDVQDLAEADGPRREAWEQIKATMAHIDAQQTINMQDMDALYERLLDMQHECEALRHGITQMAALCIDVLRRLSAQETGIIDDLVHAAQQRGEQWLSRLESDILEHSTRGERAEHEE